VKHNPKYFPENDPVAEAINQGTKAYLWTKLALSAIGLVFVLAAVVISIVNPHRELSPLEPTEQINNGR
jgi:hypothetical protein